jgi:hypothetical protein
VEVPGQTRCFPVKTGVSRRAIARRSGVDAPADECDASNSAISLISALASQTSRWSRWREMAFIMDFRRRLANVSDARLVRNRSLHASAVGGSIAAAPPVDESVRSDLPFTTDQRCKKQSRRSSSDNRRAVTDQGSALFNGCVHCNYRCTGTRRTRSRRLNDERYPGPRIQPSRYIRRW